MNRTDSLERWRRIARGDLEGEQLDSIDLNAWIREVAAKVVDADTVRDAVRPATVLEAVGLGGRRDMNAELREQIALLDEFPFIDEQSGAERAPHPGERMRGLLGLAQTLFPDADVADLRKRIERLLPR